MNDSRLTPELCDLFAAMRDPIGGEEHAAKVAELEQRLLGDPELRRLYSQYLMMCSCLQLECAAPEGQTAKIPSTVPGAIPVAASPRSDAMSEGPFKLSLRNRLVRYALAASLVLAVGVTIAAMVTVSVRNSMELSSRRMSLATLVDTTNAVFDISDVPTDVGSQLPGGFLRLKDGSAKIAFHSGAEVTLYGPCEFGINSPKRGYLKSGKITAYVPEQARGFTVGAPACVVIDLGTRFTMTVGATGVAQVAVLTGKVRVEREKAQPIEMTQNQRAEVDAAGAVTVLPDFTKLDYAQQVLSMGPVVYYRMDPDNKGRLVDIAGHNDAQLAIKNSSGQTWVDGRAGKAINFRGPGNGDYASVSDYPKATDGKLTVTAWVLTRSKPTNWSMIASNWGMDKHGQFHFCLHHNTGDLCVEISQADGSVVEIREGDKYPMSIGEWHHVAFVVDRDIVQLYRDGQLVTQSSCKGLIAIPPVSSLVLGAKFGDDQLGPANGLPAYWDGLIDEFAIFNTALNDEQITGLYRAGARGDAAPEAAKP